MYVNVFDYTRRLRFKEIHISMTYVELDYIFDIFSDEFFSEPHSKKKNELKEKADKKLYHDKRISDNKATHELVIFSE